jgi:glycosyltransferase involved in cell wall biosynthesis
LGIVLLVLGKVGERYAEIFPSLRKHLVELPYVTEEVLPIVFRAADLLVMPSTSEGWGIALIQALACGTPVVASQHVPSAFATKGLGVVNIEYETNSPRRLAESILTVLNDESLETRNWDHIFGSLVLNYSWEKVANSHFEAYNELVYENSKRILA